MRGEYLKAFQACWKPSDLTPLRLEAFSDPWDPERYAAKPITEVYIEFSERMQKAESDDYMRTLTGQ